MESKVNALSGRRDLASLTFKGQCYASRSKAKCALCGREISRVYILKDPENRSVPTGSECFRFFKTTNPELFKQLQASAVWLQVTIAAEERDTKIFQPRAEVNERVARWRKLKTQAIRKIQAHRKATGKEWLPENLYELHEAATRMPIAYKRAAAAIKWYDTQIELLQSKMNEQSAHRS